MSYPPIAATDSRDLHAYPIDRETAHQKGIPHRAVHIEIVNNQGKYFIMERTDGRLEILGGHVDWLKDQNRPESYEEAALREIFEELELSGNWGLNFHDARMRLKDRLCTIARIVNQIPGSQGNNNEWVMVCKLDWQNDWGNPCDPTWKLNEEVKSFCWLSLEEIEQRSLEKPMGINAALRLFFHRQGILVPLTGVVY